MRLISVNENNQYERTIYNGSFNLGVGHHNGRFAFQITDPQGKSLYFEFDDRELQMFANNMKLLKGVKARE